MAAVDDLNAAVAQLAFNSYNNAPISQLVIKQLLAVASQLSPGAPLSQLQATISQLQLYAPNNASAPISVFDQLTDVSSQLTFGTQTTNPPDIQAIGQLSNQVLVLEPDWAPLLWVNWMSGTTTLTVQVRGISTLNMVISASPWWTYWPNFPYDAADNIVSTIYLQQMAAAKFDQSSSSQDITVSTDGLTAARTQITTAGPITGAPRTALSTPSRIAQVYAELKMHKNVPQDNGVGISNSSQELINTANSWLGSPGNNSIGLYDDSTVWLNGLQIATAFAFNDGDIIGVALDCIALTVQFRNVTQAGSWSTAFSIAALGAAPFRLGITVYQVGEYGIANFVGPYIGTPLSGFGTWT